MDYQLDDLECCPRCTINGSKGRLTEDPCFVEKENRWLLYIRCLNCGWRYEVKGEGTC